MKCGEAWRGEAVARRGVAWRDVATCDEAWQGEAAARRGVARRGEAG